MSHRTQWGPKRRLLADTRKHIAARAAADRDRPATDNGEVPVDRRYGQQSSALHLQRAPARFEAMNDLTPPQ
jgi:hypothetical protein